MYAKFAGTNIFSLKVQDPAELGIDSLGTVVFPKFQIDTGSPKRFADPNPGSGAFLTPRPGIRDG